MISANDQIKKAIQIKSKSGAIKTISTYKIGEWILDIHTNCLIRGQEKAELESRLVSLLLELIDHQGVAISKDHLLSKVWAGKTVTEDSLLVAISQLRKALGDDSRAPTYIKTLPGFGYQLVAKAEPVASNHRQGLFVISGIIVALILSMGIVWFLTRPLDRTGFQTTLAKAEQNVANGDPASLRAAVQSLRGLASKLPNNADLLSELAEAKMRLMGDDITVPDNCAEIMGLLNKALILDTHNTHALVLRGDARFFCQHDYAAAEADYKKAIGLNPQDDNGMLRYSGMLLAQRRFDEAQQTIEMARHVNPLNYSVPTIVWMYQMAGRDDLALQEVERLAGAGSDDRGFHISATRVYAATGRPDASFSSLLWLMRESGYSASDVAAARKAFETGGLKAVNLWLLTRKDNADLGQYKPPLSWARYALAAGKKEQAMDLLEQAAKAHQLELLWADVDPAYEPLRRDPRFQVLLGPLKESQTSP